MTSIGNLYIKAKHKNDKNFQRLSYGNGEYSLTTNIMYCSFWGNEERNQLEHKVNHLKKVCPDYEFVIAQSSNQLI